MSKQNENIAAEIVEMFLNSDAVIFTDQSNTPYAALEGNGNAVCEISSSTFTEWLGNMCYENLDGYIPSDSTEKRVVKILAAKARLEGECHNLDINVAHHGKAMMYDLGNGAIRMTNKNWSVVKNPPTVFRKPTGQQQQPKPKRGGDAKELLKFMNVSKESEQILLLCYVITLFIPGILYPVLVLHGTQGAGKSLLMQLLKSLTDHSELDTGLNTPKDEQDLALHAYHNFVLSYDNVSTISKTLSDALCKATSGAAFSTRMLYSNNRVFSFKFNRPIILNGLNQVVTESDLLDRSITIQLERITKNRKEPGVLRTEFEKEKPYILGAIFDTIVQAQAVYDKVQPDTSARMLDFNHWGCAIAEVLGYGQDRFKQACDDNKLLQHSHAIEANPVGQAVVKFMRDKTEWSGTPSQLYAKLETIWTNLRLERPKDAPRLSKALNTLSPNLFAKGIKVKMSRGDERLITLTKTTDGTDATDGKIA